MGFRPSCFPEVNAAKRKRALSPSVHEEAFRAEVARARTSTYQPRWLVVEGVDWFVARVMTGSERRVVYDLDDCGFRAYAPLRRDIQRCRPHPGATKREKRVVAAAAFPGYVFVGARGGVGVRKGMHDKVVEIVGASGAALRIPGAMIAALNEREMSGEWDRVSRPILPVRRGAAVRWAGIAEKAPFSPGDEVRVVEGPFAGFAGVIEALPPDLRVRVELAIFGRATPCEFDACQIEKVS